MPKIIENFFENNIFTFESFGCDCVEDIHHTTPGMPPLKTYKLQSYSDKPLLFGYMAKTGLSRIAVNGTSEEDNILGSLIALPTKKITDFYNFFERNGFLFPISHSEYESIEASLLYELILRIRATVELMTAANEIDKDYEKIINLTLYLMLSEPLQIEIKSLSTPYKTCQHSFKDTMAKANSMTLTWEREQENFNKDTYSVFDTIVSSTYELDINEYNDVISGTSINGSIPITPLYRQIMLLYCNYNGSEVERRVIDFLFHLQHDFAQLETYDIVNGLTFITPTDLSSLSENMKSAILEIARFVLGEEINANLNGIHPEYNPKTMTPSWKLDSLLSAIYFSIFYLKPDLELYRQCANPRCQKYFLVKTTSTRTRYCCTDCCNRVTQDRYRKKKREQGK
ncbi:CGNR zinc finger domain-containing protein [Clostridium tyrobutyricum]|uniref:CGNR zinc finger domain-containing protein n=1 Tax=Clostridium tyrobutyricum TaxID=1519 RepID=UPI0011C8A041|nr:CGNR zinc finger domain-containing protein [Clostridium tyrobutyricum]